MLQPRDGGPFIKGLFLYDLTVIAALAAGAAHFMLTHGYEGPFTPRGPSRDSSVARSLLLSLCPSPPQAARCHALLCTQAAPNG